MVTLQYRSKPRWRESEVVSQERSRKRQVLVALEPASILLRLKGTRRVYRLPITRAYQVACFLEAARIRAEKKAARKAKSQSK